MGDFVRVETSSGVATIRVDRPKMNALNPQVLAELTEAANAVGADPDVRAAVIWGGPRIFAAGADIGGFTGLAPAEAQALSRQFNDAFLAVENMPQITVAAVNGYALGGGMELAMAAEFRVAADDAVFGQPEIKLGIIPGGGGTQRLPRLVGITKAKEIIYTGRNVYPDEALAIGLVSAVHPAEETYDAAVEMAAGYAAGPAALRMAKQAVMDGLPLSLADAVARETEHFGECFTTDDSVIGVASFMEKGPGKATFTGR
ncbi:MAG: enoyl-CoA hydratase/isomerase family protein [Acidimicrobiaceae bacterium]|nr:enoyl-CoA hydratase/isomerase family protein [Acidimicrobiaceae bacterium]MYF41815.1 enoyl-CoA hydratase/isomerase family protein [Acidimicrobiaceae bacterium]MYJ34590.1 enoyl-CoA hydratase/isomerase family protein [Acidimicrobiaceae bacterium]